MVLLIANSIKLFAGDPPKSEYQQIEEKVYQMLVTAKDSTITMRDITQRNFKLDGRRLFRSDIVGIVEGFKEAGIVNVEEGSRNTIKIRWTGKKLEA